MVFLRSRRLERSRFLLYESSNNFPVAAGSGGFALWGDS